MDANEMQDEPFKKMAYPYEKFQSIQSIYERIILKGIFFSNFTTICPI